MPFIEPRIAETRDFCKEMPAPPAAIIVFGASGDLTRRKLLQGLFALYKRRLLAQHFYMLGCGRTQYSDEDFRNLAADIFEKDNSKTAGEFLKHLYYISGDYGDIEFYQNIKRRLEELDKIHNQNGCHIFYLAIPPTVFDTAIENLGKERLFMRKCRRSCAILPPCYRKTFWQRLRNRRCSQRAYTSIFQGVAGVPDRPLSGKRNGPEYFGFQIRQCDF